MVSKVIATIIENKKKRIEILKKNQKGLLALLKTTPKPRSFKKAIKREGKISVIAEIKRASPSAGIIRKDFSFFDIFELYIKENVNAISIVTEEDFFLGKISYIQQIRDKTDIPILRKDFILDEIQILESRVAGADAILLIKKFLELEKLAKLYNYAKQLGMDVIVEVHTEKELRKVLSLNVDIIGINNRNLNTFTVDLSVTQKLIPFVPADVLAISESGIKDLKDMLLLKGLGVSAVLIGESLMRAENISQKLRELHIDRD